MIDYSYYVSEYMGNSIAEADFPRLSARAEAYLATLDANSAEDGYSLAACAVADAWQENERGGEVQSQTVGSWSRTYAVQGKSAERRLLDAARLYLPELGGATWI